MKKIKFLLVLSTSVILLSGCGTTAKFIYPASMKKLVVVPKEHKIEKTIAVYPFDDYRGDSNLSSTVWLYVLPLCPFGWVDYERPDGARMFVSIGEFEFTPTEDLAKAAAVSLRQSNLYSDAYFSYGGADADLVMKGTIYSTKYKGYVMSYGLSVYGAYLWVIGAPMGFSNNEFSLELRIESAKTKEVLWRKKFDKEVKVWQWIYYRVGDDVRSYSELMQNVMNEAITDISKNKIE